MLGSRVKLNQIMYQESVAISYLMQILSLRLCAMSYLWISNFKLFLFQAICLVSSYIADGKFEKLSGLLSAKVFDVF